MYIPVEHVKLKMQHHNIAILKSGFKGLYCFKHHNTCVKFCMFIHSFNPLLLSHAERAQGCAIGVGGNPCQLQLPTGPDGAR